jgi:hypothetical protein
MMSSFFTVRTRAPEADRAVSFLAPIAPVYAAAPETIVPAPVTIAVIDSEALVDPAAFSCVIEIVAAGVVADFEMTIVSSVSAVTGVLVSPAVRRTVDNVALGTLSSEAAVVTVIVTFCAAD